MTTGDVISLGVGYFTSAITSSGTANYPSDFLWATRTIGGLGVATSFGLARVAGLDNTAAALSTAVSQVAFSASYSWATTGLVLGVGEVAAAPFVGAFLVSAAVGMLVEEAYSNNWGGMKDLIDDALDTNSPAYADAINYLEQTFTDLGNNINELTTSWQEGLENITNATSQEYQDFLKTEVAADLGEMLINLGMNPLLDHASDLLNKVSNAWNNFFGTDPNNDSDFPGGNENNGNNGDGGGNLIPGFDGAAGPGVCFPDPSWGPWSGLGSLFDNPAVSPLVLDLDGSGDIELNSLQHSTAFFDLDGDGKAEHTGWISGGDGFLAIDSNVNDRIDDITELFGNGSTDGFVHLAELDATVNGGNNDGVIDSLDGGFGDLRIWQDANANGFTDDGELQTLGAWNISAIDLNASSVSYTIEGNQVSSESSFTMDSTAHVIKDIWFENNPTQSITVFDDNFTYDEAVLDLPNLRGFGKVADLWVAMTDDSGLLSDVQDLITEDYSTFDYENFRGDVEDILLAWTSGDAVATNSRGINVDAQHLTAIEAIMGRDFLTASQSPDPDVYNGPLLEQYWDKIVDHYAVALLSFIPMASYTAALNEYASAIQIEVDNNNPLHEMSAEDIANIFGPIIEPTITAMDSHPLNWMMAINYDYASDTLSGDLTTLVEAIEELEPSTSIDKNAYWEDLLPLINAIADSQQLSAADYEAALDGSWLETLISDGPLVQLRYDYTYIGTSGNNTKDFTDSDPHQYNNKFIAAGEGDDFVHGSYGANTFYYNLGDGHDEYYTWQQDLDREVLLFGDGITIDDIVSVTRNGTTTTDVILTLSDGGSIVMQGQLGGDRAGMEFFEFYDGTRFSKDEFFHAVKDIYTQNPANIYYALDAGGVPSVQNGIVYDNESSLIKGYEIGIDSTTQTVDNTALDAVFQSQRIFNGELNYEFALTNGTYKIDLLFAELYHDAVNERLFDIYLEGSLVENNLDVFDEAGGQYIALTKTYQVNVVDEVLNLKLDTVTDMGIINGIVIRSPDITGTNSAETLTGTALSEKISGLDGADTITGGKGNDILIGGSGNDRYNYAVGHGSDRILDSAGTDSLVLDGIESTEATFYWQGEDSLIIEVGGQVITTVEKQFAGGFTIESFVFDDVTLSSTDVVNLAPEKIGSVNDDLIVGYSTDETLAGGRGNDTLQGGSGNDSYYYSNRDGNDTILDASGTNTLVLGAGIAASGLRFETDGDDIYIIVNDHAEIRLQDYHTSSSYEMDAITFANGDASMDSSDITTAASANLANLDESLTGGAYADYLRGFGGDDLLTGDDGANSLEGGRGNDTLVGGVNSETYIYALGHGDDVIEMNSGGDDTLVLQGFALSDLDFIQVNYNDVRLDLNGGGSVFFHSTYEDGFDLAYLIASDGNLDLTEMQSLTAMDSSGYYTITGSASADNLDGGAMADIIYGGGGDDELDGYADDDILYGEAGEDILTGGDDHDLLDGGANADYLYGNSGNDTLVGGTGNDILYGDAGNDTYLYNLGDGNDTLEDSAGTDEIKFGAGITVNDLYATRSGDALTIHVEGGGSITNSYQFYASGWKINQITLNDTSTLSQSQLELLIYKGGSGNDSIDGSSSADAIDGRGGNDTLNGGNGNDTIYGGTGTDLIAGDGNNDVLYGDANNDTMDGGSGNDTIDGGTGDDSLTGGSGNDVFIVDSSSDSVSEGSGGGTDTVNSSVAFTLATNFENLILTGSSNINGTGNTVANALTGNSGANSLSGGNGVDTITGGAGIDSLTGGSGNDIFIFTSTLDGGTSSGNRDIISDFTTAGDDIDLSAFTGTFTWRGTSAFTSGANEVRYSTGGGNTIVEIDSDANGTADLHIQLTGTIALVSGDFIL